MAEIFQILLFVHVGNVSKRGVVTGNLGLTSRIESRKMILKVYEHDCAGTRKTSTFFPIVG